MRAIFPCGHWAVCPVFRDHGGWIIQWSFRDGCGTRRYAPLPQHTGFKTRKEATEAKRRIRGIFGQQGNEPCGIRDPRESEEYRKWRRSISLSAVSELAPEAQLDSQEKSNV
jgi:hypothetical protein